MNQTETKFFKKPRLTKGVGSALVAFAGWAVLYVVFGLISPVIFSAGNGLNLLRSMSKYLIIGVGQGFLLISGNIDLSTGSLVAVSTMISATLMTKGVDPVIACLVALAACLLLGLINGVLVGVCKIQPFIATLGTMFIGRGVAYLVNGNHNTDAIQSGIGKAAGEQFQSVFYYGKTLGIYNSFWIALILFAVLFFVMQKTRVGRHLYAVGSNPDAAKFSGIHVPGTTIFAYMISAFCAFVVGLILCAQSGMGSMEAGLSYEMYSVAANVIGGVSPLGGSGLLLGTLAGAGVWQTLENGLGVIGVQVGFQRITVGVIVVIALLVDVLLHKKKG